MCHFGKQFLIIATAMVLGAKAFAVGGDKDNGGFHFSRTGHVLLTITQQQILGELTELVSRRQELVYQDNKACPLPVDFRLLRERLTVVDYDYNNRSYAKNPKGVTEERHFRINEKNRVEAMRLYFEQYSIEYNRYEEANTADEKDKVITHVRVPLLHEVLHTFGYDELMGRDCAPVVSSVIESYSTEKMSRWIKQIQIQNLNRTIYELNKSDCYTDEWQKEMQFASVAGYSLKKYGPDKKNLTGMFNSWRVGARVLACMLNSGYKIKAQLNEQDITIENDRLNVGGQQDVEFAKSLAMAGYFIVNGRSIAEVATALNKLILFEFIKPIPQPK
jgi:hypothetical protein